MALATISAEHSFASFESMAMTPDEVFASCERSDRALSRALGSTLQGATLRLVLILLAMCATAASFTP